jgi:hypothetical protein
VASTTNEPQQTGNEHEGSDQADDGELGDRQKLHEAIVAPLRKDLGRMTLKNPRRHPDAQIPVLPTRQRSSSFSPSLLKLCFSENRADNRLDDLIDGAFGTRNQGNACSIQRTL